MDNRTTSALWLVSQWVAVLVIAALTACGGGGGGGAPGTVTPPSVPAGLDYAPLAVGDTWVYRRGDGGLDRSKVTGTRVIDGQTAFVVTDSNITTGQSDATSYRKSATALTEVPDGSDPFLSAIGAVDSLRLPLRVGDSYTQVDRTLSSGFDIDGDNRADTITVRSTVTVLATETVTVPAGTFPDCMKVRTQITQIAVGSSTGLPVTIVAIADEWYAADVGVVRRRFESIAGNSTEVETRELQSWRVGTRSNDSAAPRLTSTTPAPGATVGRTVVVVLDFDEPIDSAALTDSALSILNSSGAVVGTGLNYVTGSRLRSNLPVPLPAGTYTLVLDSSVQDLLGNRLPTQRWALTVDGTGPALVSSLPAAGSTQVALASPIDLQFSEAVNLDSVLQAVEIALVGQLERVRFTVSAVDERTVRLQPEVALQVDTAYEVRIAPHLSDLRSNSAGTATNIPFSTGGGLFRKFPVAVSGIYGALAVGDVSGDGRVDIVSVSASPQNLQVRRQLADGTLDTGYTVPLRTNNSCGPDSIQIADFNGDGRLDVVVGEGGCGLELLLQNASGVLEPGPFLPSADSHVVRVADLNGDGRADILGLGSGTTVSIWLQRSDASWGAATLVALAHWSSREMAVGDINGDGRPDIVVASDGDGPLVKGLGLLLQRADGDFSSGGYLAVDPVWGARALAIGDVNGDGRADIVAGFYGQGLAVFKQGTNGQMQAMQVLPGFDTARSMRIVDLNGDGRQDLVVRQDGHTPWVILVQQTDGTLRRMQQLDNQLYPLSAPDRLDVGDLNGDGLVDLMMSGAGVLYATPRTAAPSGWAPGVRQPQLARTGSKTH